MRAAAVIGDVVGSRGATDRARLHEHLAAAIAEVNEEFGPSVPLRITVGDEYQGIFATIGDALAATLRVRLAMLPEYDVRHGVGWGDVEVLQEEPRVEDGPGWWAARAAIEWVADAERRAGSRSRRTSYRIGEGSRGPDPAAIEAALALRDEMVTGLGARSVSVLRGLLAGETQRALATRLEITASAVSQRVRGDGLAALVAADESLREVR